MECLVPVAAMEVLMQQEPSVPLGSSDSLTWTATPGTIHIWYALGLIPHNCISDVLYITHVIKHLPVVFNSIFS